MSVTNLNEIDKADVLVAGLRKHTKELPENRQSCYDGMKILLRDKFS